MADQLLGDIDLLAGDQPFGEPVHFGATSGGLVTLPVVGVLQQVDAGFTVQVFEDPEVVSGERRDLPGGPADERGFGCAVTEDGGDTVDLLTVELVGVVVAAVETLRDSGHDDAPFAQEGDHISPVNSGRKVSQVPHISGPYWV